MTTYGQPDHSHHAESEAMEGRILNRMAEMEIRLVRDINTAFWRQVLALVGILLTVLALFAAVLFFTINNLSMQIDRLSRLAGS